MRVERFKASSMREAMNSIKAKLGEEAVILHSRETDRGIEIIAAVEQSQREKSKWFEASLETVSRLPSVELELEDSAAESATDSSAESSAEAGDGGSPVSRDGKNGSSKISSWEELIESVAPPSKAFEFAPESMHEVSRRALDFSQALRKEIKEIEKQRAFWTKSEKRLEELKKELAVLKQHLLSQELAEVKERARLLKQERMARRAREAQTNQGDLLEDLIKQVAKRMANRGFSDQFVQEICRNFRNWVERSHLNLTHQADLKKLEKGLIIELKKMIKVQPIDYLNSKARRHIAIVGRDGPEKAETTLKMAINYQLAHRKKVAVIIASDREPKLYQQTALLAGIAKVPFSIVADPVDLAETLSRFEEKDIILLDLDFTNQARQNEHIERASLTEIHLIIPAKSGLDLAKQLIVDFEPAEINYLIFTRTREQKKVGYMVEVAYQTEKPISYLCGGDTIPDDIESANALKIAHMILKG